MRYRGGERRGYTSRLHYFSEWISDGERRGLVRDRGAELGGVEDARPLRFMTGHRAATLPWPTTECSREIAAIERRLDGHARRVVPTRANSRRSWTGSRPVTCSRSRPSILGLDVTHTAIRLS